MPYPFVAGQILRAEELNFELGEWINFTPNWNGVTLGTGGSSTGQYRFTRGTLLIQAGFTLGTGGATTAAISLSDIPGFSTIGTPNGIYGWAGAQETGGTRRTAGTVNAGAGSVVGRVFGPTNDTTTNTSIGWGHLGVRPFTWSDGDNLDVGVRIPAVPT